MDAFLLPYAIIFGTAAVLFGAWWLIRRIVVAMAKRVADETVAATRRHKPPASVALGANAWSCSRCRSVNRPDAVVCYSCRGKRDDVEEMQGRI